jgi:hypothetical protein
VRRQPSTRRHHRHWGSCSPPLGMTPLPLPLPTTPARREWRLLFVEHRAPRPPPPPPPAAASAPASVPRRPGGQRPPPQHHVGTPLPPPPPPPPPAPTQPAGGARPRPHREGPFRYICLRVTPSVLGPQTTTTRVGVDVNDSREHAQVADKPHHTQMIRERHPPNPPSDPFIYYADVADVGRGVCGISI